MCNERPYFSYVMGKRRGNMARHIFLSLVKEERNLLHTIRRRKSNWIGVGTAF
jgi:hypothetical protein